MRVHRSVSILSVCWVLLLLALAVFSTGCVLVPPGETGLKVQRLDGREDWGHFGMSEVYWTPWGRGFRVTGVGSYNIEDQWYLAFPLMEAYYSSRYRRVLIACKDTEAHAPCTIELLLDQTLLPGTEGAKTGTYARFTGEVPFPRKLLFGKLAFTLQDVEMTCVDDPSSKVRVTGRIVARRLGEDRFAQEVRMHDYITGSVKRRGQAQPASGPATAPSRSR